MNSSKCLRFVILILLSVLTPAVAAEGREVAASIPPAHLEESLTLGSGKEINPHILSTTDGKASPCLLAQYPSLNYPIVRPGTSDLSKSKPTNVEQGNVQSNNGIVMYGRQACGYTTKYMKELQQAGIPFVFKNIDDPNTYKEFTNLLDKSRISGNINLPVIDNDGKVAARPDLNSLIKSKQTANPNNANNKSNKEIFNPQDQKSPLTIYSLNKCNYTKQYMEELKELGVKYSYKDLDNASNNKDFSKQMTAAGYSGNVDLPAVFINGKVYFKPTVIQTLQMIKAQ